MKGERKMEKITNEELLKKLGGENLNDEELTQVIGGDMKIVYQDPDPEEFSWWEKFLKLLFKTR